MAEEKLRKIGGDHPYSLSDDFGGKLRITQTAYFKAGNFIVAIGELNKRNRWNDAAMKAAMAHLQKSWNEYLKVLAEQGSAAA